MICATDSTERSHGKKNKIPDSWQCGQAMVARERRGPPTPLGPLTPFIFIGPIIEYQWNYMYGGGHVVEI